MLKLVSVGNYKNMNDDSKQEYIHQILTRGLFAEDESERFESQINDLVDSAKSGDISSLNTLWSYVKQGLYDKEEYHRISDIAGY